MKIFPQSRALDDFMDALRPELSAMEAPRASEALKQRILTSRAAGARVILPDALQAPRRSLRAVLAISVAAALVAMLIPFELQRSRARADDSFASPDFFGQVALAQTVRTGDQPRMAPARAEFGRRLRPMSLVFSRRLHDSGGRLLSSSELTLAVSEASVGRTPAWRLETRDNNRTIDQAQSRSETTYVAAADLGLLRRDVHVQPYRRFQRINVHQLFTADSVTGRMTTDGPSIGQGRSFRRRLSPAFAPYITGSVAPVFLMAVPLGRNWKGSASLLGWAVRDDDVFLPIELRVEGEETVSTPAGRFDCWRLTLRFSGRQIEYWVRKTDGLGVRVLDRSDPRARGTREIVLMEER